MADDIARALGASSGGEIEIKGKRYKLRPLTAAELTELERICVRTFRREYLKTFADNLDLLPEDQQGSMLQIKMEECARWDTDDLPKKRVFDSSRIPVTNKLKQWIEQNYGISLASREDNFIRAIVAQALDNETLSCDECKKLTGHKPVSMTTGYVNWWVTSGVDGMVEMLLLCINDKDITKRDIMEVFAGNQSELINAARQVESVSVPAMGNG